MKRLRLSRLISRAWALMPATALLLMTTAARAQESTAAPQPNLQKSPPVWLGLMVIFILLVLVITVSLMPSRRGHQD